jgi:hypothetical protein
MTKKTYLRFLPGRRGRLAGVALLIKETLCLKGDFYGID